MGKEKREREREKEREGEREREEREREKEGEGGGEGESERKERDMKKIVRSSFHDHIHSRTNRFFNLFPSSLEAGKIIALYGPST